MKKFTLSILAVVMTAFVLTSCIDNAVSPEVKNIRAEQVNLLKAQTALQTANAAYRNAEAAVQTSIAAMNNAEAAATAAQTQRDLVKLAREQAEAEAYVAQQEVALQKAIDALAEYIASHSLDVAGDYLAAYDSVIGEARATAATIAGVAWDISALNLYLVQVEEGDDDAAGKTLATLRTESEEAVAAAQATLDAATAALETILEVTVSPADAQAKLAAIQAEIQSLENDKLELTADQTPFQQPLNDANADLTAADNKLNGDADGDDDAEKAGLAGVSDAIALIQAEYADQLLDSAAAKADVASALADAVAASATLQAELDPFLDALVEAYQSGSAFVGEIAADEHDLKVAINMYKVALAKGYKLVDFDPTADITDAPGYDDAVNAVADAIDAIQTLADIDLNIDVEDETSYPGFDGKDLGEFNVAVTATVGALAAGDVYKDAGNVNYRVKTAAAGGATALVLTRDGNEALTGGAETLTKVTSAAGDATLAVTSSVQTVTFELDDEDGVFLYQDGFNDFDPFTQSDELVALYDGVTDLLTSPDPGTELAQAGLYLGVIEPFFEGGAASDLIDDIGRYNSANFLANLTDEDDADFTDGDVSALPSDGDNDATDANGWTDWKAAKTAYATEVSNLNDLEDASSTDAANDEDDNRTEALGDANDILSAYLDNIDNESTDGGSDDANDVAASVATKLAAAETAYDAADAAQVTAQDAYDVYQDQIDEIDATLGTPVDDADADVVGLYAEEAAVKAFIDGSNSYTQDFMDAVADARVALDQANYALITVDFDETKVDALIAKEEAYKADLEAKLVALQDAAEQFLGLLNDALGN